MADIYDFNDEKDARTNDEYEKCIICRKQTKVLKSTPIKERKYYVEGAGQLCKECFLDMNK